MSQTFRLPAGGRIDRSEPLTFTFDGQTYTGYRGDTVASALLANGVHLVGRSFKYHRPRGIVSAGVEEPNALIDCNITVNSCIPSERHGLPAWVFNSKKCESRVAIKNWRCPLIENQKPPCSTHTPKLEIWTNWHRMNTRNI